MAYLETKDGVRLFYNDWGRGSPIVLVHGWPLSSDMWEYQASALVAAGFRVVAYDRRGFGRSDQPWDGYDYDTLSDDLATVIRKRELKNAFVVGFSMGGGEVARYMTRHNGADVARIGLVSAVTPYLLKTADNPEGVERAVFDEILQGLAKDRPAFLAGFAKKFYGDSLLSSKISKELLEASLMVAMQGSGRATEACARSFSGTDFRTDLAAINVPTLVIHGDADVTVPIDASGRRTARLVRGAVYQEYAGEPHGLFYTARDRFNADLIAFGR